MIWTSSREDSLSNIVVSHILDPVWEGSGNYRSRDSMKKELIKTEVKLADLIRKNGKVKTSSKELEVRRAKIWKVRTRRNHITDLLI